jgi:integrase
VATTSSPTAPAGRRRPGRSSGRSGLPGEFRFHDLRHYLASLLIGSGLDVKVVQHRLRHGSAKTTLDVYGHLWPDSDESARAAVGAVLADRAEESLSNAHGT